MKNKYLIITCSDSKYGDFLMNHWLKSLYKNINPELVDIVVLDYGLNAEQIRGIKLCAKVIGCKRDGNVVNLRYRDALTFLKSNKYEQVALMDGGDIIFQDNIMAIFEENAGDFRAATEGIQTSTHETALFSDPINQKLKEEVLKLTNKKRVINGGLIVAPRLKFMKLCRFMVKNIKKLDKFGSDQLLINYYFYKYGFFEIDRKYNFIIATASNRFKIKNGFFLDKDNKKIPIVHNTGGRDFWRPIKNFGYGPGYNKIKPIIYYWLRFGYGASFIVVPLMRRILKRKN